MCTFKCGLKMALNTACFSDSSARHVEKFHLEIFWVVSLNNYCIIAEEHLKFQ